jgi:hypothetical protein
MNFSRRVKPQLDDDEQLSDSDRPRESSVEGSGNGANSESERMSDPGSETDSEASSSTAPTLSNCFLTGAIEQCSR